MKRFLLPFLVIVAIIAIWELVTTLKEIPSYLLPKPSEIGYAFFTKFPILLPHFLVTLQESFFGFFIGSFLGFILALIFDYSRTLKIALYPFAIALKSVPIVALAPLLLVWLGNSLLPIIIIAAIISFFPVVVNVVKGLGQVDKEFYELFKSLDASRMQFFLKYRIHICVPYLFSALKMSATLAVIGALVGEFSGSDGGLGYFIIISSHRLETVDMFLGIALSSCLGIAFFYIIELIEYIFVPWRSINLTKNI